MTSAINRTCDTNLLLYRFHFTSNIKKAWKCWRECWFWRSRHCHVCM